MVSFLLYRTRIKMWKNWTLVNKFLNRPRRFAVKNCASAVTVTLVISYEYLVATYSQDDWVAYFPCKDYSGMQRKRLTFIALNKFSTKLLWKTQCTGQGYVNGMLMFKIAFSFVSNINQSARSSLDWLLKSQSELTECCISIIGNNTHYWDSIQQIVSV